MRAGGLTAEELLTCRFTGGQSSQVGVPGGVGPGKGPAHEHLKGWTQRAE